MVPYELDILLWYYARVGDHPDLERNPPIWAPTMKKFLELELVQPNPPGDESFYALAERGKAFVDALQRVPLPVQIWTVQS